MSRRFTTLFLIGLTCTVGALAGQTRPADPPATAPAESDQIYALMTTNLGEIVIELDPVKAPLTVQNYLGYVDSGYYDGTVFHRVMSNFMIQGGGFTVDMQKKPTRPGVKNEWRNGLKNSRGTISMARVGGQPDSGTSQFFINVVDNAGLDKPQADGAAYAVFGRVVAGMDVVDTIRYIPTTRRGPHGNVPKESVVIKTVRRIDAKGAHERIKATEKKAPATQPAGAR